MLRFLKSESGASAAEYALILAVLGTATALSATALKSAINTNIAAAAAQTANVSLASSTEGGSTTSPGGDGGGSTTSPGGDGGGATTTPPGDGGTTTPPGTGNGNGNGNGKGKGH
jgi:Flp pilus assembly pilin Flp